MAKGPSVSFANLTCRFGEKFVLLDLAQDIVLPAFLDSELKREYSDTTYFFLGTTLADIETETVPLLIVYGRLVKDTLLTSEQTYTPEHGLVPNVKSISSAPSSFFVLVLNDHKLIYLPEMSHAPLLGVFEGTLQKFLSLKYKDHIDNLFRQLRNTAEAKPKKQLYMEIPHPDLHVLPLASKASIEDFLKAFAKLTQLEFTIKDTNAEYQMKDTFEELRRMKTSVHSTSTKLVHLDRKGLDKVNAVEQIHAAAASGNEAVKLAGESVEHVKLRGDNHNFNLQVPIDSLPADDAERAFVLVRLYRENIESGILSVDVGADTDDAIQKLRERLDDVKRLGKL